MGYTSAAGATANETRRGVVRLAPRALQRPLKVDAFAGTAPTVTLGTANAATGISGATRRVAYGNPALTYLGAEMQLASSVTTGYADCVESRPLTSPNQSARGIVEFATDADRFEFFLQCTVTSQMRYRVWVDGQPLSWTIAAGAGTGAATYRLLVDFTGAGGRAFRTIRLEWNYARLLGITCLPGVTLWKTPRDTGPAVAVIGDSFSEGSGGQWWWDSWAMHMGRALGWNVVPLAVGSTGYLAAPAPKVKYRDRLVDLPSTAYGLDLVCLAGGYNDASGFSSGPFQAEVQALHAAILAAYPTTGILQFGPFWPTGVTSSGTPTGIRDAIVAAVLATNTAHPGAVVGGAPTVGAIIDPILFPASSGWVTGSGNTGTPNGTGNSDWNTSADAVHPSAAGHEYLGRRAASEIIRLGIG